MLFMSFAIYLSAGSRHLGSILLKIDDVKRFQTTIEVRSMEMMRQSRERAVYVETLRDRGGMEYWRERKKPDNLAIEVKSMEMMRQSRERAEYVETLRDRGGIEYWSERKKPDNLAIEVKSMEMMRQSRERAEYVETLRDHGGMEYRSERKKPDDLVKGGVCMMNIKWRDEQHPSYINFISSFLSANSFRLNFVPIAPDFIFNCGGVSVAFMFVTNWSLDDENIYLIYSRAQKLKEQFAHFYVVLTLPTKEQNESFIRSYFKSGVDIGKPIFTRVQDLEMGFEKLLRIAHSLGVCKQQDIVNRMKAEREEAVQTMDTFLRIVTSIPGLDSHDASSLQAIGSIKAIASASKQNILENTDLSADKAENVTRFFRDPKFYLNPKLT